ncbi:MAG: ABC transporter ATP-binding protein [Chloroflexota bacterium]
MEIIQRSFVYLRPYGRLAVGAFVAMLTVTAVNLTTPQIIGYLIDEGITPENWNAILLATTGLVVIAILRGVFNFLNTYWSETASQGIAFDLRNEIYRKLETLSISFHDEHQTGQLMTRATSDVEGVRNFFAQGLLQFLSAIFTFVGSIVILFVTEWRLALAVLATIPFIIAIFVVIFSRMGPLFARVQQNLGQLNTILQENIAGVQVVKAFTGEKYELARYSSQNDEVYDANIATVSVFSLGFPTVFLLSNVGTLIVIWFGGYLVIDEQLSLGTLIAFNAYLSFLLFPIFQLGFISQQLSRATASGGRLFAIIDAENEIVEKPDALKWETHIIPGRVTFEDVRFRYPTAEEDVLQGVSFDVEPGANVAILGPTGSGKSSIINLIPRFYDVSAGSVKIDGVDVRDLDVDGLRHRIGMVLQEVNLIRGTIRDNIAFGAPDAAPENVEFAAKLAQAHDFIMKLEQGYDTMLGERGAGLSGGQRQRIAIARALLVKPSILIMDDSTSALDAETEHEFQQAMEPLLQRVTAFIIAQRISTVRSADLIFVLDQGEIVARGTHEVLMEHSPLYAEIVNSQLAADEGVIA